MTKISVVILNWNGKRFLEKFLKSVVSNIDNSNTDIWVADNGSTDSSVSVIQDNFPDVKLICFDKNYGFTGGYNKALSLIEAEYYILLNSDVEVTPNWIEPVIEQFEKNPQIAAAAPKIKSLEEKQKFEYAGAAGGYIDYLGFPFCRGRVLSSIETDSGQYDTAKSVFWASGACMFIRASIFHQSGGFDNLFFAHMEEFDLCWRMKNAGYLIYCFPQSTVYHVGGGTLPNNNPHKLYLNYRNNLLLLYKNLPTPKKNRILIKRFFFDMASAFMFLLQFKGSFTLSVLKAYRDFFKLKKKYPADNSVSKKHNEMLNKSIVLNFFFRRKNKFSDYGL